MCLFVKTCHVMQRLVWSTEAHAGTLISITHAGTLINITHAGTLINITHDKYTACGYADKHNACGYADKHETLKHMKPKQRFVTQSKMVHCVRKRVCLHM